MDTLSKIPLELQPQAVNTETHLLNNGVAQSSEIIEETSVGEDH